MTLTHGAGVVVPTVEDDDVLVPLGIEPSVLVVECGSGTLERGSS